MAGQPCLAPSRKHALSLLDTLTLSIAEHLNTATAPVVVRAAADLLAGHAELRMALERALGFAQWLEERAQGVRHRATRQAGEDGFGSFFNRLFGERDGAGGAMDERIERDLKSVREQVQVIDAAAASIVAELLDADAALLALVAQRDESPILRLLASLIATANERTAALRGLTESRGSCAPQA